MILKAFSSINYEIGNLELSQKLGFPRSTVNRLLHILVSSGFIQQNQSTKKYMLGQSAAELVGTVNRQMSSFLSSAAKKLIDDLRDQIGETAAFEILSGEIMTIIYITKGPNPVSVDLTVGDTIPIHVSAGGKCILAFSDRAFVDNALKGKFTRYTDKTITNPNILKKQIKQIRQQGYAFDYEELDIGVCAIGAPVLNHDKKPVASVIIAAPAYRVDSKFESRAIPLLKSAVSEISSQLFYSD